MRLALKGDNKITCGLPMDSLVNSFVNPSKFVSSCYLSSWGELRTLSSRRVSLVRWQQLWELNKYRSGRWPGGPNVRYEHSRFNGCFKWRVICLCNNSGCQGGLAREVRRYHRYRSNWSEYKRARSNRGVLNWADIRRSRRFYSIIQAVIT